MKKFVLVLVCLIALVSSTYAIECYDCAQCKVNYTSYKTTDCDSSIKSCLKITDSTESIVMRTCAFHSCDDKALIMPGLKDQSVCYSCDSDLCNGVGKFTSSTLLIALLPVIVVLFKIA